MIKNLFQDTTLSYADSRTETTTIRVCSLSELSLRRFKSSSDDKNRQPVLCSFTSNGKKKNDFNRSNVCFVDLDTKEYTSYILSNKEEIFRALPFILAIQESFSGKIHFICRTPMAYTTEEFMKYSLSINESVHEYLNSIFNNVSYGYGCFDIDLSTSFPHQLLYVSSNEIFYNEEYNEYKIHKSFFNKSNFVNQFKDKIFNYTSGVKNGTTVIESNLAISKSYTSTTDEYNTNFNTTSLIGSFLKDTDNSIDVKYLNRQLHLDYNITTEQLNEIKDGVIKLIEENKQHYGRLLLRPHINYEGIVDIKMNFYFKKDGNNKNVKLKQGQHRRLHMLRWIKQTILNAIATYNHNGTYEYICKDIVYTIYWMYYECISIYGNKGKSNRDILDRTMKYLVNNVCTNWNKIKVEYKTNRYICKPENNITTFGELMDYWRILKEKRYSIIEETFFDMMNTLSLNGKTQSEIARILNENNIEAKTEKGWTSESVRNIMCKFNFKNTGDYKIKIDELLSTGKNYADIADCLNIEGYVTKQGKPFTKDSIKNYVRSLKKSKSMERIETENDIAVKEKNEIDKKTEVNCGELDITQKLIIEAQLFFKNPSVIDLIPSVGNMEFISRIYTDGYRSACNAY